MKELANPLSSRFSEGLGAAAELHARQARKGTEIPYVAHLMRSLSRFGASPASS